jgi:hypothetical protein
METKVSDAVCRHGIMKRCCAYCRAQAKDKQCMTVIKTFSPKVKKVSYHPETGRINFFHPVTLARCK